MLLVAPAFADGGDRVEVLRSGLAVNTVETADLDIDTDVDIVEPAAAAGLSLRLGETWTHPTKLPAPAGLDEAVRRMVRQRLAHLTYCAERSLRNREPGPRELSLELDQNGRISSVTVVDEPEVAECLEPLVARWPVVPVARDCAATVWIIVAPESVRETSAP